VLDYENLSTEKLNPRARGLDRLSLGGALRLMDREDAGMLAAVRRAGPAVARGAALIARRLAAGGRLFFAGSGTSGRLGVLEAAECPPTFDTRPDQVRALMAGGRGSVFRSKEGAEDRGGEAGTFVRDNVRRRDVLIGVAASGATAFALAALAAARGKGAATILVTCNPDAPKGLADVFVCADTGAEIIAGSTRLKAGTATKIILNRLTTLAMVRLGKTYGPFMVDLQPRSKKLVARALRLVRSLGGVGDVEAGNLLRAAGGRVKTAILMARRGLSRRPAEARLRKAGGFLAKALSVALLAVPSLLRAGPGVKTGLDVLESREFAELKGRRVGIVCNKASVDRRGRNIVDLLRRRKDLRLTAVFSPEHGFSGRGEHGQRVENGRTPDGVPIYSLYGAVLRPTPVQLQNVDVLVFDLQDTGARFYTYLTTMGYSLEAARDARIPFIVLDRPNPSGGIVVEGEMLDPAVRRFTGYFSIPVRHGMTTGEVARFHNAAAKHPSLSVVSMEGWRRDMIGSETGLKFNPPSPNIRTPDEALLYPGIGCFEATNVSVGRGTDHPFEVFGAPWMDGEALAAKLAAANLPGIQVAPVRFTPKKDLYAGKECRGVRIKVTDPKAARPVDLFIRAAWILRDLPPKEFEPRWTEMPLVTGTAAFETLFKSGAPVEDYLQKEGEDVRRFMEQRKPFLLYE
jgi:N-acetylmuramic acid 6-phosphate etherase